MRFLPVWVGFAACVLGAHAQEMRLGQTTQGNTGGLVIPSADVLPLGSVAASLGNYSEPKLGSFSRRRNFSLGLGLLPNVELFGRFAEFQNPLPDSSFANGPRDISANVKVQFPSLWRNAPKFAVGLNDVFGGAVFFKSAYAVLSDQYGPLKWTAGYAWGRPILGNVANGYAFNGVFGGAEAALGSTGFSALAEYDGQQKHAGLRYYSQPIAGLAHAQVVGTLQRSFGATDAAGRPMDRNGFALTLVVPLGQNAERAAHFVPGAPLASLEPVPRSPAMLPTPEDRLDSLRRALASAGLERVRVGVANRNVIIEYENHRFGQNEADAIGVVLGLAVEHAPTGAKRVSAVTLKAGLPLYETSVGVAEYRNFLRDGDAGFVGGSLAVDRSPSYRGDGVTWIDGAPTPWSPVRVEIKPEVNYTIATDVGAFDYSAAANVKGIVPLWRGAELYTSYINRLGESENFLPGAIFSGSRLRNGLKAVALEQSFWLGSHVLANFGVGRFRYETLGVQAETTIFVPGRDDVVRLQGAGYERLPGEGRGQALPTSATYRYVHSPSAWLEGGVHQYTDGSRGPSLMLTRWFGDVGVHLFYRKGGSRQFAGLEFSIPLTPRRGMEPGPVIFTGTSEFQLGVRTRLVTGAATANTVQSNAVREFQPDYDAENQQLNRGRTSEKYFISQLYRMREAFFLYGRALLAP
jgi:hypothetical protein